MNNNDKIIDQFFEGMRLNDKGKSIPDFELPQKRPKLNWPLTIAAVITLVITASYFFYSGEESHVEEVVVILNEPVGSNSLQYDDNGSEKWQSQTQSLINDF